MKTSGIKLFMSVMFALCLLAGCQGDNNTPSNPVQTYELSDIVIIVDNQNPNAVSPPCGAEEAVCGTITDGLLSASQVQDGIPTVLVRPGMYTVEAPAYSFQIAFPVVLKSEANLGAVIRSRLVVLSPGVTIEGFIIRKILVKKDGSVAIDNSLLGSDSRCGIPISVELEGRIHIENSDIQGTIEAQGDLITLDNNTISSDCFGTASKRSEDLRPNIVTVTPDYYFHTLILSSQSILNNNIIQGNFKQEGTEQTALSGNTIHGHVEIFGGRALLDDNIITNDTSHHGIFVDNGDIDLTNNTIVAGDNYHSALFLASSSTAFMSNNRFDAALRGILIIDCDEDSTITTDGTNTLLNDYWISCNGLPPAPAGNSF